MKYVICLLTFSLSFITSYSQTTIAEASPYVFPEFTQGVVLMKSGVQYNSLLNYNSVTEEMIFDNKGKKLAIAKEEVRLVDTIFIKDRKFFGLHSSIFVEFIEHSTFDLYAEHKCKLKFLGKPSAYGGTSQTSASTSAQSFYSGGDFYALKLPEHYETLPYTYYWLKKNGKLTKFTTLKQLMKFYDDKTALCKAFVKTHDLDFEDEANVIQFINYIESN